MRSSLIALATCFVLSGCASTGSAGGDTVSLEGRVTAVDASRTGIGMSGEGIVIVNSPEHGVVTVRVPTRDETCEAQGLAVFHTLAVDNRIRVVGAMTEPGVVTPCADSSHRLERLR
ncbi:MAG: hypothetical protein U5R14_00090 [Gemmatimonadota bacterium]|nr:hypothetical protein [Gemmatimonadota bacterium]